MQRALLIQHIAFREPDANKEQRFCLIATLLNATFVIFCSKKKKKN